MFENNSPLVRQSNIFKRLFVFERDGDVKIPSDFSELSEEVISEFKKYDDSTKFVFDIYHLYSTMYYKQFFAVMKLLPNALDIANFGETKERNKNTINRATGDLAANLYINKLFDLETIEPFLSVLALIPQEKRSDYLLHFAACFCLDEYAGLFKSYLTSQQVIIFNKFSTKTKAIRAVGENLFKEQKILSNRRDIINSKYNEKGFIYFDDGSVEMMDFDDWAHQNGYKLECDNISHGLEALCVPLETIIQTGLSS